LAVYCLRSQLNTTEGKSCNLKSFKNFGFYTLAELEYKEYIKQLPSVFSEYKLPDFFFAPFPHISLVIVIPVVPFKGTVVDRFKMIFDYFT
jgi:hypothetical protein